ncbi:MAG: GT4 family glycosyltransferase PelF [Candidatus Asgardarchaeia archaeon]
MRVCMIAEGTYPVSMGGVATWIHTIIENMPDIEFSVVSLVPSKEVISKFSKTKNLKEMIYVQIPESDGIYENPKNDKKEKKFVKNLSTFHDFLEELNFESIIEYLKGIYSDFATDPRKFWKSKYGFEFLEKVYKENYSKEPFYKWLVAWKNSHAPIFSILKEKIPEADVYHASNSGLAGFVAILGGMMYNKPVIITDHGIYIRELRMRLREVNSLNERMFLKVMVKLSIVNYFLSNLITVVCNYNKNWISQYIGVPPNKISVVYNGIDTNYFRPLLIPREKYLVGTVAVVHSLKNVKDFIKAAGIVAKKIPEAKFVVIGPIRDKVYWDECERLINLLGLEGKFQFLGPSSNTLFWYNSMRVFVLSSASEAFPISTIEAMACGTPVVVTDVGGAAEAVDGCGFVVPPFRPRELAEMIIWLLTHEEEYEEMSIRARERAVKMFSKEVFIKNMREIYESVYGSEYDPIFRYLYKKTLRRLYK